MTDLKSIVWGLFFVLVMVAWIGHGCQSRFERFREQRDERREHREQRFDDWRDERQERKEDRGSWFDGDGRKKWVRRESAPVEENPYVF